MVSKLSKDTGEVESIPDALLPLTLIETINLPSLLQNTSRSIHTVWFSSTVFDFT